MARRGRALFFPIFFGLIIALFVGIMLYTWHEAKAANPVILDERGNVRR